MRAAVIGIIAWVGVVGASLKLGAVSDAPLDLIVQLRLPRALLASAIGIALSVSGAALQALFANPLCEPYTLGISSGAALGAVIGVVLGLDFAIAGLAGPAFIGALAFAFVLYLIARRPGCGNLTLLLSGVMLGFLGSSLVALWMALADSNGLQSALLWLMGDLSRARLPGSLFSLAATAVLSVLVWRHWRDLDGMLMGEEGAMALGVPVRSTRRRLVVLISLLIGLSVSGGGMIGFVGLVVPHFVRRMTGSLHLKMLPLCAIWGAVVLAAADVVARSVARPYELPVGVVTAIVGAPLFLWLVIRTRTDGDLR